MDDRSHILGRLKQVVFRFIRGMRNIKTIKSNNVFNRAYNKGKSVVAPTIVTYIMRNTKLDEVCIGITASKKMGCAVRRNRARRIIREAFRLIEADYPALRGAKCFIVFVARGKCFNKSTKMQDIKSDIENSLVELNLISKESI